MSTIPSASLAAFALLLVSCEGDAADEKLTYLSGDREVKINASQLLKEKLIVHEEVIFVHAVEAIRIGSPQGYASAASLAELRAAEHVARWLARVNTEDNVDSFSVSLKGGVTLRQQVKDGHVHVFRAYRR